MDILRKQIHRKDSKRTPETVHHSLAFDSGGRTDFGSVLVRLDSKESKSPTAFSEGKVRLSESSGNLECMEDGGGWCESSASSASTIDDDDDDDVATAGPRTLSSLRCLPIVWPDPPAVILF